MKKENKVTGKKGEDIAKTYLKKSGYEIIETNFRCKVGEADLIVKKAGKISFIEVKTRKQRVFGEPAESVDTKKKKHIYKVAEFYTYFHKLYDIPMSLDVIEVYILAGQKPRIAHIMNAIIDKPEKAFQKNWNQLEFGDEENEI